MIPAPLRIATQDAALSARVVRRVALHYAHGPDPALDRPGHVRAGSGLAWLDARLACVQDDAAFAVVIDPATLRVDSVPLPAGGDGLRQFDDVRGNKALKLDLEACVAAEGPDGPLLVAFGSGSTPLREVVVTVVLPREGEPAVAVHPVPALYAALRAATDFSGSEMNVEGATLADGRLRLFGRGNGAAAGELLPVDAVCELDWAAVLAHLADPGRVPPPLPERIVRYELGELDGLRLTFTDGAPGPAGTVVFSASAEDSPDATRDGRVAGSAVGVIHSDGRVRWTPILAGDGGLFDGKVEGVELSAESPLRAWAVVDRDEPATPAELCEIELSGPWWDG